MTTLYLTVPGWKRVEHFLKAISCFLHPFSFTLKKEIGSIHTRDTVMRLMCALSRGLIAFPSQPSQGAGPDWSAVLRKAATHEITLLKNNITGISNSGLWVIFPPTKDGTNTKYCKGWCYILLKATQCFWMTSMTSHLLLPETCSISTAGPSIPQVPFRWGLPCIPQVLEWALGLKPGKSESSWLIFAAAA